MDLTTAIAPGPATRAAVSTLPVTPEPLEYLDEHDPMNAAELIGRRQNADNFFGEDGLTFGDILDIINPLQHLPIVSSIYRAVTGDTISPGARIAGGVLFGGPIGLIASLANAVSESETGKDLATLAYSIVAGPEKPTPVGPALAASEETGRELTSPAPAASYAVAEASEVISVAPSDDIAVPQAALMAGAAWPAPAHLLSAGRHAVPVLAPSSRLQALAAAAAAASAAEAKAKPTDDEKDAESQPASAAHPPPLPHPHLNLPLDQVPTAMLEALLRYEAARRLEHRIEPS